MYECCDSAFGVLVRMPDQAPNLSIRRLRERYCSQCYRCCPAADCPQCFSAPNLLVPSVVARRPGNPPS